MALKIELKRGSLFVNITSAVRVSGCELSYKFGTDDFKYAPDLMDFSIKSTEIDLINYLLHQHLPNEVIASDDATGYIYFNGYLKPSNNISISYGLGDLSVSCVDSMSIDLERPTPQAQYIDTDLQTIATSLVTHAELQFDFPGEMANIIVPYFILEEDDEEILKVLDDLLWEYGWTLYQKHSTSKIVSARPWFLLVDDNDVLDSNVFDVDLPGSPKIVEPFEIQEDEIEKQVISVDWIVASNINRVEESSICERGAQLYLHPRSTQEKGVASIGAGQVWPPDGLLVPTYFRYGSDAIPDIIDASRERIRIIHGFNQCVQYVGETDDIVLELEDHSSTRSRLVFKNNGGQAIRLRGFLIRGSAIYSQGTYTVLGGIYTEPFELTAGAVVRSTQEVSYTLVGEVSDQDNFYIGWNLLSEYGTNVRVTAYSAAAKRITVSQPLKVSDQDIEGTDLILLSPDVGLAEEKYKAEHLYNDLDAKRLCLSLINLIEFGRYTYSFEMLYSGVDEDPTGVRPQVQSITANKTAIHIVYDKTLDTFSVPMVSFFTVIEGTTRRQVSSVAVTGNTVVLYLSVTLSPNTQVTVQYSRPTNNPVQDRESLAAPSFAARNAMNTTIAAQDNRPPELRQARIVSNELELLYDKALSTRFIPPVSSYTVTENGEEREVIRVSISNRSVNIVIEPAVRVGTRVYVSYNVPPTNAVRSISQRLADDLVNQLVSNRSVLEPELAFVE